LALLSGNRSVEILATVERNSNYGKIALPYQVERRAGGSLRSRARRFVPALKRGHGARATCLERHRDRTATFDPPRVARPVNQGGWGLIEGAVRYSRIDLTSGALSGGEMDIYSLGFDWWLTQSVQVVANYRLVMLDGFNARGVSSGFDVRLFLMLM
jgi:hypothetical protein